jgi:magnesium transporter
LATASEYIVTDVPTAKPSERADTVLASLAGRTFDVAETLYILDEGNRLVGLVPMADLLAAASDGKVLGAIMIRNPPAVRPEEDQEDVAMLAIHHDIAAIPVTDDSGRFLGIVPSGALLRILREEGVEDLHRMAGLIHAREHAFASLEVNPVLRAWHRLPWLLVGLVGAALATVVMAGFEEALTVQVSVAFFVPAIVYLADAVGTQSEAAAVRHLALAEVRLWALVRGEALTGILIGAVLGVAAFLLVWLTFGESSLAAAVGLALFVAGAAAGMIGILLPLMFDRLGADPAYASGPVGTIIQDVLSLLIYFAVVQALLI